MKRYTLLYLVITSLILSNSALIYTNSEQYYAILKYTKDIEELHKIKDVEIYKNGWLDGSISTFKYQSCDTIDIDSLKEYNIKTFKIRFTR